MLQEDLTSLLDRMHRISRALDLGCTSVGHTYRDEVAGVLLETCWEGLRLGHELTRQLAYDDLWSDLQTLGEVWDQIVAQTQQVHRVDLAAQDALGVARVVAAAIRALGRDVAAVEDAQLQVTARPRDHAATRRATAAIRALEGTADRFFVDALGDDRVGRLDAAMAVLTTVAARAARERAAVARRR